MEALKKRTDSMVDNFKTQLNNTESNSVAELEVKRSFGTIEALQNDIEAKYKSFNSVFSMGKKNQAELAYQLTERIGMLTELTGGAHCANCASGKDRTGEHSATFCGYAAKIQSQISSKIEILQKDPNAKFDIDIRDNTDIINDKNSSDTDRVAAQKEKQRGLCKFMSI